MVDYYKSPTHEQKVSKWCFWSTAESVRNRDLSVTALLETIVAVGLYLWVSTRFGLLLPLYIAVAAAPFVLLRSEDSVALGLRWFALWSIADKYEEGFSYAFLGLFLASGAFLIIALGLMAVDSSPVLVAIGFLLVAMALMGLPAAVIVLVLAVRIFATLACLPQGLRSMPENFRVLVLCTSPAQIPELVPGLNDTNSPYSFLGFRRVMIPDGTSWSIRWVTEVIYLVWAVILFAPAWLYRLSIKSTAWFWWPLAFLGADLGPRKNPKLVRFRITGSLWARTTILVSCLSLLAFISGSLFLDGTIFKTNPLLTPLGYLLIIDWEPRLWQLSAISASALSLTLVFLVNSASGEYEIARDSGTRADIEAAERKFYSLERLARFRLLVVISFWLLVGGQALLFLNGKYCWLKVSPSIERFAQTIYGSHFPENGCNWQGNSAQIGHVQ